MKKFILFLFIALAFSALGWFGGRKFFPPKEDVTVSGDSVSGDSVSGDLVSGDSVSGADGVSGNAGEVLADVSGEDVSGNGAAEETVSGAEAEGLTAVEKLKAEEGTLYAFETSANRELGAAPIVGGDAVILMDGGSATTHQGEYAPKEEPKVSGGEPTISKAEQEALQGKLDEQAALAASEGKIGAWAFYREAAMKEFAFPEGVNAVEKFAFARSGLESVVIPDGVTSIGAGAFYHCDSLADVAIPDSVTEIGKNAFSKTPWLEDWMAGGEAMSSGEAGNAGDAGTPDSSDFLIVGDGVLIAYRGSEAEPVLPPAVKTIAPGAFGQ